MKKKYKPVALKTHPVLGTLPSKFHIEWNIIGNLLIDIPTIPWSFHLSHPMVVTPKSDATKPMTYICWVFSGPSNAISYTISCHSKTKDLLGTTPSMIISAKISFHQ